MESIKKVLHRSPQIKCLKDVKMLSKMTPKIKIANIIGMENIVINRIKQHSIIHAHRCFCLDEEIK